MILQKFKNDFLFNLYENVNKDIKMNNGVLNQLLIYSKLESKINIFNNENENINDNKFTLLFGDIFNYFINIRIYKNKYKDPKYTGFYIIEYLKCVTKRDFVLKLYIKKYNIIFTEIKK